MSGILYDTYDKNSIVIGFIAKFQNRNTDKINILKMYTRVSIKHISTYVMNSLLCILLIVYSTFLSACRQHTFKLQISISTCVYYLVGKNSYLFIIIFCSFFFGTVTYNVGWSYTYKCDSSIIE